MNKNELDAIIDSAINENAEKIDVKVLSVQIAKQIDFDSEDIDELKRGRIEQMLRNRLSRIKDVHNVRDFFAIPIDGVKGVYANATKSRDDVAMEKAASLLDEKSIGLQASRDKLLSQVFKIRHNVELKDDGTLDLKSPYVEQ